MKFSKNVNNKKLAPKLIFFNEKKIEKDSDNFWHRKWKMKLRNWHFSIAWFRADVDLTKKKYEKVQFFTQLSYHLMGKLIKKFLNVTYCISTHYVYQNFNFTWFPVDGHFVPSGRVVFSQAKVPVRDPMASTNTRLNILTVYLTLHKAR